jgi:hypothetical protein
MKSFFCAANVCTRGVKCEEEINERERERKKTDENKQNKSIKQTCTIKSLSS